MNTFQTKLFSDLMALCAPEDSPFYFVDHVLNSRLYRVFTYRLASYTDFLQPNARECRGHMFEIDRDGNPLRLASLPMQKFFNLNENPFTMGLTFTGNPLIMDKMDGSLISTYLDDGELRLKTKTALHSEQANAAYLLLRTPEYDALYAFCKAMAMQGITVNMEYTAPENRIVLPYQSACLTVLNARVNADGSYVDYKDLSVALTGKYVVQNYSNYDGFVDAIPGMRDREGFVILADNGEWVKVKTDWYATLHRSKDSVNSPKALFECVVLEAHDDLRAHFHDDQWLLDRVNEMELRVKAIYSELRQNVDDFYNANKGLDRKSYALLGQSKLPGIYFGLAMNMYLGRELDYKAWMLKNYKVLGIRDEAYKVE